MQCLLMCFTVDMMASPFDPTAAITSWRYDVEKEEPYAALRKG